MHNAPPVVYPVGRFVWGSWMVAGLALAGWLALVFWWGMGSPGWAQTGLAGLAWLVSVVVTVMDWPQERSPQGCLVWSGEDWSWRAPSGTEMPVRVQVLWDAGRLIGLAYTGLHALDSTARRSQFAVVSQAMMPSSWHGFRCAVYSRPVGNSRSVSRHGSSLEI
jgi:hypothetical protein